MHFEIKSLSQSKKSSHKETKTFSWWLFSLSWRLGNKFWKLFFQQLDFLLQGNSIKVLRAKEKMGIKNPNKNDPFSGGHHTFFQFCSYLFFFYSSKLFYCFSIWRRKCSNQAAQRTKGTSSTRYAVTIGLCKTICKAVVKLLHSCQ